MGNVKGTIVAAATVAGVAGVLALNPSGGAVVAAASAISTAPTTGTGSPVTGPDTTSDATEDPAADPNQGTTTKAAPSSSSLTYSGSVFNTPFGPIQLEATITDGVITDISWLSLPDDPHSARINSRAAPALVEEALTAQSATVDSISGASWTSEGFRTSLQSIFEQAGL